MISFLSENSFLSVLSSPEEVGINPIFRAEIVINGTDKIKCYIKPQPDRLATGNGIDVENKELTNEAIGYILAKKSGLYVPSHAGIINLLPSMIPGAVLKNLEKDIYGGPQSSYLAWFSEDMEYPNFYEQFPQDVLSHFQVIRFKKVIEKLASHEDTPKIISLDDWLLNSDRHLGNLLNSFSGRPILIDHGRVFKNAYWIPEELCATDSSTNVLCNELNSFADGWSTQFRTKGKRKLAYNAFHAIIRNYDFNELSSALAELGHSDNDIKLINAFLYQRTETSFVNDKLQVLL